jgi:nucleoside-diphosphate-sugar epimerase
MRRKLMDSTLAKRFGWVAPTALDDGLARTVAYYRAECLPA